MRPRLPTDRPTGPLPAPSLLQLMWLASPALPVGGFSYSEGLEAAVESGRVGNVQQAGDWLLDQLHLSLARGDLAVLTKAVAAWRRHDGARLCELNDWVLQTRESAEFRLQSEQMGRSMLEWLRHHDSVSREDIDACLAMTPTYPVAFALAASTTMASVLDIALTYSFGWAENMMQAAIKAVPLGQIAGQQILSRLAAEIPAAVDHALGLADSERQAFSPMLAILSAQHEAQYSRIFRS